MKQTKPAREGEARRPGNTSQHQAFQSSGVRWGLLAVVGLTGEGGGGGGGGRGVGGGVGGGRGVQPSCGTWPIADWT